MDRDSRGEMHRSRIMTSLAWLRMMSAVPMGGNAELVAVLLLLPFGEAAGFQVQVPLQPSAGGGAD